MQCICKKMKNSQRTDVRQYHKSDLPRLRWTTELHKQFVEAVERLGGKHKATPKRILQMMRVKGLKISHIKSHLQMYRNMKVHAMLEPVDIDQLLGGLHVNDLETCSSISTPQRSLGTEVRVSEYERRIVKQELLLLDSKGFSQSSEETDYDLNQDPETSTCFPNSDISNEEENRGIKFHELSLSFHTSLIPFMHNNNNNNNNQIVDSNPTKSLESNHINLDLTI